MRPQALAAYGRQVSTDEPRTFFVECYVPGIAVAAIEDGAARARRVATELRGEGREIEYVQALHVPGDEVVFHVFAADDEDVVREASTRASLPFERVVESVSVAQTTPKRRSP